MVDVVAVTVRLEETLSGLSPVHRVAFAAAAAQRFAPALSGREQSAAGDAEFLAGTQEALWSLAAGDAVTALAERAARVAALPELTDDEEGEDPAFFAEAAIVLLHYALQVATEDPAGIRDLITRSHDVTDALDDRLEDGDTNLAREIARQDRDATDLAGSVPLTPASVSALRDRALADSRTTEAVLSRVAETL